MYPTKKLWEIVKTIRWVTYKPSDILDVKTWLACFRTKNIQTKLDESDIIYIDKSIVKNEEKFLQDWDLLISSANSLELLWKCCLIENLWYKATLWWFISCFRPLKDFIDYNYFYYFYNSDKTQKTVRIFSKKTTWIANLQIKEVEQIPIPLPPLSTQKLIVQKLDSAFENIDKNINLTKENLKNLEELNKSVLEKVFSEWEYEMKKLWEIFDVRDWTHDSPKFFKEWFPLVTSKNLIDNSIDLTNVKLISENDYININKRSKVDKWDLLFAMIWTIWNPTIVNFEPNFAIKNVALFKKKNEIIIMEFLKYYLLSDLVIKKMLNEANWATQKFVWLWYLRSFQIPLPPLEKQKEIVSYLDEVFAKNKELKTKYELQLKELEELKQSLLKDAFEWRLVKE